MSVPYETVAYDDQLARLHRRPGSSTRSPGWTPSAVAS